MVNDPIKRDGRQPGSLKSSEEIETQMAAESTEIVEEEKIGPEEASPHWIEFYRSIRDAIAAMRSESS
ncbi:hypothetical protein Back11_00750 [Paenibacillus baekrokdamisoli]|uniref:Uncharacterized protein n=2 Tax=Paenibacillus baekrokdamisoli TaxID=1712516 RepID=A0A3G9IID0_9BACL|nr:hypothetical protein [Paenibacillus baekrokdamisoli]BBH18730.1 hypothetical protein Back11_00750 [Paenibacillus baekrokdamisoli]